MQALLERQTKALESIQKDIKQDKIIQIAQLYEEKRLDEESNKTLETLKSLDKGIKKLNDSSGNNLNGNVIKLFKEIQKVSSPKRNLNSEEVKSITGASMERRQFNTLRPRVDSFKDNVKDFFTMRGFLDKTGIATRGSGGIISEYLDRGEAKKKYIDQRMKTKGTTFGSRETFARQFDEQQKVQYEIRRNEAEIQKLRESGATDIGLKRSGLLDKRAALAASLAKVDPSVRPEGFDPKTGKVKIGPQDATEQQARASAGKVTPTGMGSELSGEETMLEQNRMVAEQSELLKKIEENTRGLKGNLQGSGTTQQPAQEEGGLGLMDMLGNGAGRLGKIAKTAGRGLLSGAKAAGSFMLRRAGPLAAAAAVGMGAYEGYKGWTAAGDKQDAAKEDIKAKLESGEITQGEANQLTKQVDEQATVEKGAAAGKGTGMAIGGAAGALKGAAAGAAIGSVVPVVGTVVGGAIGATVGAIGGSWLGGKGGEWLGKKAGQAKNWAGNLIDSAKNVFNTGTSGKEAAQNMDAEVAKRMQAEGVEFGSARANQIRKEVRAEILQKDPNAFVQADQKVSSNTSLTQTNDSSRFREGASTNKSVLGSTTLGALFTKKGLETGSFVGSGENVNGDNASYSQISGRRVAGGLFGSDSYKITGSDGQELDVSKHQYNRIQELATAGKTEEADKLISAIQETSRAQRAEKAGTKPSLSPAAVAMTGETVSRASSETDQARLDATKGGGGNTVVSAPTINNNTQNQTNSVKLSPRNNDSTVNKYMQSRWAI